MDIYGMMSNDCIMKLSYAADVLTVSEVIDLSTYTYRFYTITPEHFDVTQRHFAIMSPVQCDPDNDHENLEYVTSPSVDVYQFSDQTWSCTDLATSERGSYAWSLPKTTI